MPSNIPRYHTLVTRITDYFKEQDAITSDKFLKLQNDFSDTKKFTKHQKDFDFFLALTHEEYLLDESNRNFQDEKRAVFRENCDKITHQKAGRYWFYRETDSETESETEADSYEFLIRE